MLYLCFQGVAKQAMMMNLSLGVRASALIPWMALCADQEDDSSNQSMYAIENKKGVVRD